MIHVNFSVSYYTMVTILMVVAWFLHTRKGYRTGRREWQVGGMAILVLIWPLMSVIYMILGNEGPSPLLYFSLVGLGLSSLLYKPLVSLSAARD